MSGARSARWKIALSLALVVLAGHGGSLGDGLFFDDYWHRATLRGGGWGWTELVESATFDLPGELAHLWWQDTPLQWRYARPVAMAFMKLEYRLSGGAPAVIHAFGLLWHWGAGLLVFGLARRSLRRTWLAFFCAAVFVLHPHQVFGVSWIAARNAVVSGFFFLAAAYLYSGPTTLGRTNRGSTPLEESRLSRLNARQSPLRLAGALLCWLLALFARETAIVFPAIAVLLDAAAYGWSGFRRRAPAYLLMGLLAAGYLYWRLVVFPAAGPPEIYFTAPHGPAYAAWAASKLLHMLFAMIVQTPMFLGLATYAGLSGRNLIEHAVMTVVVAVALLWYVRASRGVATRWTWLAWLVLGLAPVVPVFVMPHFAYLPAAGLAIMIGVLVQRLRGAARTLLVLVALGSCLLAGTIYRYAWRAIVRSEQVLYADIGEHTPAPPPGAKLFFIDFPVAGIYGAVALREAWDVADIDGHFLTLAPHPLAVQKPCVIEVLNERDLVVSTPAPGYFSGHSGRMMLAGMRSGEALRAGATIAGELFDTTILEATDAGVTRLKFTFHQPLSSPEYYFFVSTPDRPAQRIRFDDQRAAISPEHVPLFEGARAGSDAARRAAGRRIRALARRAAELLADPMHLELDSRSDAGEEWLERMERWWRRVDASRVLDEDARWQTLAREALFERGCYSDLVTSVSRWVRSDLYLTGDAEP
ncbi:MAG: hypothetical protein HRF50_17635 [Phycisphaerae bacterium]|jgi:hypothetical protein